MGSAFWLRWRRCKLMPFWDSPILIPSVGHPDMTSLYLSRYVYIYIHVCIYIHICIYIWDFQMPIWRRIHRNFHILSTPGWLCMCMCVYICLFTYLIIYSFMFLFILISCDIYILHRNPTLTGIISPYFAAYISLPRSLYKPKRRLRTARRHLHLSDEMQMEQ